MTERTLGKPIAQGRTADVYAWGDGHVLKLFHDWFSPEDIEYEARLARAVHACGLPVPAPGEIRRVGGRAGLVYERVDGTPMLAVLQREPWRAIDFARRLARLHARMHASALRADVPAQRRILESKLRRAAALPAVEFIAGPQAQGEKGNDILRNGPGLTHEDIAACLKHASHPMTPLPDRL